MQCARILSAAALAILAGSAAIPVEALAAGSIKAAYVEQVIPAKTYNGRMAVLNSINSIGPGTGILGVTSLTLTNFDTTEQQVYVFAPVFAAGSTCGNAIIGGSSPGMTLYVPPHATLHLAYPTPLVFSPVGGVTCVGAEVTTTLHGGSVEVDVNGVVN